MSVVVNLAVVVVLVVVGVAFCGNRDSSLNIKPTGTRLYWKSCIALQKHPIYKEESLPFFGHVCYYLFDSVCFIYSRHKWVNKACRVTYFNYLKSKN